ncbi:SHUGOSHIN 2 isoform X2 [Eutrema salsugineum]|nr:SHUGOSHIN 2 isoform X2 [Eutrema salsugineum]
MSSAQRRKLADISNLQDLSKQMNREDTRQQQNMLFSSKEYAEKLQKENMTLMKALAHRNKIIELSGVEFQKMRINLRNVQEKNLQFAQANSHMLAELNTNRDRLKQLQHELGCKNVLLEARKMQLEEQPLPCTHHASEDKALDMNRKDTKRKRTSRIKQSSNVKPILVKEDANSKRKASEVIDTSSIPEVTCQTENDFEKGVVANQIVDNVVTKKFDLDAANLVQDTVHSKRQCVRRKSTRFDFQETEQTEKLLEMEDAKEIKETARLSLRRRSARLRPEEAELCKNFHERDEVRETIKRRRVSSRKQSARFDFQEPEVIETLNADDAGSLVSDGSRSEAVKPSESRHDIKDTNGKRRVSMRRQPTKGKSQTATDTDGAIKEIAKDPSLRIDTVEECVLRSSSASKEDDHERESKKKPRAEETEGMMRRTSVGRPSRHAAEKVQSYREVSLKAKMRRNC